MALILIQSCGVKCQRKGKLSIFFYIKKWIVPKKLKILIKEKVQLFSICNLCTWVKFLIFNIFVATLLLFFIY